MALRIPTVSLKTLLVKIVIFMVPWSIALYLTKRYYPELVDMEKVVSSGFANTFAFLVAYVLTVIGFRYYSKEKKDAKDERQV